MKRQAFPTPRTAIGPAAPAPCPERENTYSAGSGPVL